ncbi:MAG: hypothetical protein LQ340_002613 [Diploschistes diacapsis]|nr:MAG: hypothetical protein LQ340_002613 [Diploschistes diacapsis]
MSHPHPHPQTQPLTRAPSQELSVAESVVAVQDIPGAGSEGFRLHGDHDDSGDGGGGVDDDDDDDDGEDGGGDGGDGDEEATRWPRAVKYLVLLCAFLTSLSFGVTQVPLLYVFRLMTCDAYYAGRGAAGELGLLSGELEGREPGSVGRLLSGGLYALAWAASGQFPASTAEEGVRDRCSIHAIESSTALAVSLLGASTTVFGLANLFLTGSLIKRIGIKPTLLINVFFPALRLLIQNVGVEVWGSAGIVIVQCSQIITVLGGPSGYLLVLNTFISEVVEYEGRTAWLGRLTGSMMVGSALGFLLGGVLAEAFGIRAPFRLTLVLFLCACAYVLVFLPHIPPAEVKAADTGSAGGKKKGRALGAFFGPLVVFAPRKFVGVDGVVRTEYGATLLACGVFLGILATGKSPRNYEPNAY